MDGRQDRRDAVIRAILCSLILWPLCIALFLAAFLVGLLVVPVAVLAKAYDADARWTWKWMKPWNNLEHGNAGFPGYSPESGRAWRMIKWSCFRNPANGLRYIIGIRIRPARIGWTGNSVDPEAQALRWPDKWLWSFTWQGPFAGLKVCKARNRRMTEFWIGWKLLPKDMNGIPDWRFDNCGFALQATRWGF